MGVLQELLGAEEPLFSLALRQLEMASGHGGRDARLIADIAVKAREGIVALGLDPKDTTARELFAALMARVENDNRRFTARLNVRDLADVASIASGLVDFIRQADIPLRCWAIKRAAAKRLLKAVPPRGLMKELGYRSIDSMLKHESIDALMVATRFTEDEKWDARYMAHLSHFTASDFETRDVALVALNEKYSTVISPHIASRLHNVVHSKEMGVVGLVTVGGERKGYTIIHLVFLLHYIAEVRSYTSFFKLRQVDKDFGELLACTLANDAPLDVQVAGHTIHWRVIHRFFGSVYNGEHPELFEPHIQPEDIVWSRAEHMLEKIDPDMGFWVGKDYVGTVKDGLAISFNLLDVCLAYSTSASYESFFAGNFRDCLWNELLARYLGARSLQDYVLQRLDRTDFLP